MTTKTLSRIQQEGMQALINTLGPVDAIRFIKIYDPGYGDYTNDRKNWLPDDPDEYFKSIENRRVTKEVLP
jgi:hypothetical protein